MKAESVAAPDTRQEAAWDYHFVAVDDIAAPPSSSVSRRAKHSAEAFLGAAEGYLEHLGVPIHRVLTDNGMSLRSGQSCAACLVLGITQNFARAYRPKELQVSAKATTVPMPRTPRRVPKALGAFG